MLFNSYPFLFVFLPAVLLGFALCARRASNAGMMVFLIGVSLLFYGWWNWRYVFLLLASMVFNYAWAQFLLRRRADGNGAQRTFALALGIAVNLALLGYFKYTNFLIETLDTAFGWSWTVEQIALPLAISFFTFEQITYLVETHRGQAPAHGALHYGAFITFFPRLIAGPIVRPQQILPQLTAARPFVFDADAVATGLFILAIGLFKKVVIADTVAAYVGPVFDRAPVVSFPDGWGAAVAFALQVYFDFSGYSDMAIGLAWMLNIRLPENFDSPYQARDINDFWRRWHITLSTFLRDYLYIPLGGNRLGSARQAVNVAVTMLLCGLWHGAQWTAVAWGGMHAVYLLIYRLWRRLDTPLPGAAAWMLTFVAVLASYAVFRSPTFERAGLMLGGMVGAHGFAWDAVPGSIGVHEWKRMLPALLIALYLPNRQRVMQWQWLHGWPRAVAFALLAGVSILRLSDPEPFFYFQF